MELVRDALLECCGDELAGLGRYRVVMSGESEDFSQMIEEAYGIDPNLVTDGVMIAEDVDVGTPLRFHVAVLRTNITDSDFVQQIQDTYQDIMSERRQEYFFRWDEERATYYLPDEYREAYQKPWRGCGQYRIGGRTVMSGTIFLFFQNCQNREKVDKVFTASINQYCDWVVRSQGETPTPAPAAPQPVEIGEGDPAGLSAHDRAIYDSAADVLESILRSSMDGFAKEAAIYEWLLQNVEYDWTHTDVMAETPRESYTPYGGLVNHTAVCLGYATTFQLLMELAGIECITVVGAGAASAEDHAWNMVRLDGEWYCADVTWDRGYWEEGQPNGREWRFFNVTNDYMARTDHQWDYDHVPEATAEDHGRP